MHLYDSQIRMWLLPCIYVACLLILASLQCSCLAAC